MSLIFKIVPKGSHLLNNGSKLVAYLTEDDWDDYHFKTTFTLSVYDESGFFHEIGTLKIGFNGQKSGFHIESNDSSSQKRGYTSKHMDKEFSVLNESFFSLGIHVEYYTYIKENLSEDLANQLLTSLRDVVHTPKIFKQANKEDVFKTSLLRSVSLPSITGQFSRILSGGATLTSYNFSYSKPKSTKHSGVKVDFQVNPDSKPSSNIHIIIGRNGVGKTTLLNNMIQAALFPDGDRKENGFFLNNEYLDDFGPSKLEGDYFSSLISVSFSAFDLFVPPPRRTDPQLGIGYNYIGLKDIEGKHKETKDLSDDFIESISSCMQLSSTKELWIKSIRILEADQNFADMELDRLANIKNNHLFPENNETYDLAISLFKRMSSGHAIVLLTITKLIEKIEEKTLVLLDEPESHLHPPLLAAFIRALSDLLIHRNGIAVIATHSPVVLQEVPKSCVSILRRTHLITNVDRPEIETFAENIGSLTREVFGLEVSKSGFHDLLKKSVEEGKTYEQILVDYDGQIGFEGKAIIQSFINSRNSKEEDLS